VTTPVLGAFATIEQLAAAAADLTPLEVGSPPAAGFVCVGLRQGAEPLGNAFLAGRPIEVYVVRPGNGQPRLVLALDDESCAELGQAPVRG